MTQQNAQQSQVDRLEQRVDRMTETLATKDDVAVLRSEIKDDITSLRSEVKDDIISLRSEIKDDIISLRSEVKGDIATLRSETRDGIKILHDRLNGQNILIMTGFIVTIASVIITRLLS